MINSTPAPFKDYPLIQIVDENDLDENNSQKKQLGLMGYHKRVVDFGCATGYFAQYLKQRDCQVLGIELNPDAAKMAEAHCEQVLVADLDIVPVADLLSGQQFDVAVFGDVLEHLRDPWRVLREVQPFLKPDGYVIASIPNIAHGAIRLSLLQGQFEYADVGLLDNTHLRFFTRETVEKLFADTGYFIDAMERVKIPIFSGSNLFPAVDRKAFDPALLAQVERDPEVETLQFVVRAFPLSRDGKYAALKTRYQDLEHRLQQEQLECNQLQQERSQLQAQLQHAETHRQELQAHFQSQLNEVHSQWHQTQIELDHVRQRVIAMESSKFWLLRRIWLRLKRAIGLKVED
jgi:2-polyprenyl-3-methyl-5-hydroxy-6-metoxy-1,4-benzoquinol methylase